MRLLKVSLVIAGCAVGAILCCLVSCNDGDTALLGQVRYNHTNALAISLKSATNINRLYRNCTIPGDSASLLHVAVDEKHIEAVELLLRYHANPNIKDSHGCTPLMFATGLTDDVVPKKIEKIMVSLLKAGADPSVPDQRGDTPLIMASECGKSNRVRILLEAGARVNATDGWGNTALHVAQTPEVAILLLRAGADVNATNTNGQTPSQMTALDKRFSVMSVLTNEAPRGFRE